jgi:hypothetical protein
MSRVCGADERPVVKAGSLGPVGAAQPLPPVFRDQAGRLVRPHPAGRHRDDVAAGRGHHVRNALLFKPRAEPRVAAVDLVAGHPGEQDPGLPRAADHLPRQPGLGLERDAVADPRGPAPATVVRPLLRQVKLPVDQRPPAVRGDIGREHPDLAVLHPARCPSPARHTARERPGRRPRPTARSSAAAASRPARRPRRTPPAAASSSAPRATAAREGKPGRAAAPVHSRKHQRPA